MLPLSLLNHCIMKASYPLMSLFLDFYNRVEFEASIDLNSAEDEGDNMPSIIDEDEWTQQNFGDSLRLAQGISLLKSDVEFIFAILSLLLKSFTKYSYHF